MQLLDAMHREAKLKHLSLEDALAYEQQLQDLTHSSRLVYTGVVICHTNPA